MPLQTQSAALFPAQENLVQRSKTVSFQTPAAKQSKTTGRRAFGDISNRKQTRQTSQQKPEVTKPSQSKPSIRLERKPSTNGAAPKASKPSSSTKSTQKAKREAYESIERPYGPTARELDELYDSDDHVSVCSMEKQGFVFTRRETITMFRQAMTRRREEDEKYLDATWDDEKAALGRQDDDCAKIALHFDANDDNGSLMDALNDLSMALSDDEDGLDWSIPL